MIKAPDALWWPQDLDFFNYNDKLDCYISYEKPDLGCNYHGAAYLIHAFAGGVDITDMLAPHVVEAIEKEALWSYSSN